MNHEDAKIILGKCNKLFGSQVTDDMEMGCEYDDDTIIYLYGCGWHLYSDGYTFSMDYSNEGYEFDTLKEAEIQLAIGYVACNGHPKDCKCQVCQVPSEVSRCDRCGEAGITFHQDENNAEYYKCPNCNFMLHADDYYSADSHGICPVCNESAPCKHHALDAICFDELAVSILDMPTDKQNLIFTFIAILKQT